MNSDKIYEQVRDHYGSLARGTQPKCSDAIARAFGYSEEELSSIPAEANLGVSCGNPLAIAGLRRGETVIDLGSGAGFDVFLASKKVGPSGRAIGIDMNKDMLARALQNKHAQPEADNVSFVEGRITSIPLQDGIADCIISNCVINLVPEREKHQVFAEMARLLKPGGRVAISDILTRKTLPAGLRDSAALYVGCIAGASTSDEYTRWLNEAGLGDTVVVDTNSDLNVYIDMIKTAQAEERATTGCCQAPPNELTVHIAEGKTEIRRAENNTRCSASVPARDDPGDIYDAPCCTSAGVVRGDIDGSGKDAAADEFDLADIDLNEWAGSFKVFAVKK